MPTVLNSLAVSTEVAQIQQIAVTPADLLRLPESFTIKQKLFIYYYIQTRNGVKSAELAGYSGDYVTLCAIASENLRKAPIKQAITDYFAEKVASVPEIMAEASDIARTPIDELSSKDRAGPIDVDAKLKAIELIGKHHGAFIERIETTTVNDATHVKLDELLNTVQAIAKSTQITVLDAAHKLAEQLADVPELAAMLREWAEGELARRELNPASPTT